MKEVIDFMLHSEIKLKETDSYIRFSQGKFEEGLDELYFLYTLQCFLTNLTDENRKRLLESTIHLTRKERNSLKELVPLVYQHYKKTFKKINRHNFNEFLLKLHQLPLVVHPNTHLYLSNVLVLFSALEHLNIVNFSRENIFSLENEFTKF